MTADHVTEVPAFNPRAEVPVLIDGDVVVCFALTSSVTSIANTAASAYPADAREYAAVRDGSVSRTRRWIRS